MSSPYQYTGSPLYSYSQDDPVEMGQTDAEKCQFLMNEMNTLTRNIEKEDSEVKTKILSYVHKNYPDAGGITVDALNDIHLQIREVICDCFTKYIDNYAESDDEIYSNLDKFSNLAIELKINNKKDRKDKDLISKLNEEMKSLSYIIYEQMILSCVNGMDAGIWKDMLEGDEELRNQIAITCIVRNDNLKKSIKKKQNSPTKQYIYLELIKNIIKVKDNNTTEKIDDDLVTFFRFDTELDSEPQLISPFNPILIAQDNLNNALLDNFNNKLEEVTETETPFYQNVKTYFEGNTVEIKKQINDNYHPTSPQDAAAKIKNLQLFMKVKELSDLADLAHDTEQYYTYLGRIHILHQELGAFFPEFMNNYLKYTLPDFYKVFPTTHSRSVDQLKIRKFRADLNNAYINYLNDNLKIVFQNPIAEELTELQGFFKLIKSILDEQKNFIYVEAGRAPSVQKIIKHYNSLNDDEKEEFIIECNNYLGTSYTKDDIENKALITNDQDLMVDKQLITNFDGAGCSNFAKEPPDFCCFKFEYVFGKYTYTVFSVKEVSIYHLVVVTLINSAEPIAIFGFRGNITINMLLKDKGFNTKRSGEGLKGGPSPISTIIESIYKKNKLLPEQLTILNNVKQVVSSDITELYRNGIDDDIKELLWLGNKTIGDFVIGCYKEVKDGYTGDTGISPSNVLIFCGPTEGYNEQTLPNIWRSKTGKGWEFTEGVTNPSVPQQINLFFQNYLCILKLVSPDSYPENLTRFDLLNEYVNIEFPKIKNYTLYDNDIYNQCFVQLFIAENYVMKKKIDQYITEGKRIIVEAETKELELDVIIPKIMTLPKVPNYFLLKMNTEAKNNQDTLSLIEELLKEHEPIGDIEITDITNQIISFTYLSGSAPKIQHTQWSKVHGSYVNSLTIDYTIETLLIIYRYLAENDNKKTIKIRIINYFNTLVDNLNIDDGDDVKNTLKDNLSEILRKGYILNEGESLDVKINEDVYENENEDELDECVNYKTKKKPTQVAKSAKRLPFGKRVAKKAVEAAKEVGKTLRLTRKKQQKKGGKTKKNKKRNTKKKNKVNNKARKSRR